MRLGILLWGICTTTVVFKDNFANKTGGTCDDFLRPILLIIKIKFLVEIPEGQESAGDYVEKLERERYDNREIRQARTSNGSKSKC